MAAAAGRGHAGPRVQTRPAARRPPCDGRCRSGAWRKPGRSTTHSGNERSRTAVCQKLNATSASLLRMSRHACSVGALTRFVLRCASRPLLCPVTRSRRHGLCRRPGHPSGYVLTTSSPMARKPSHITQRIVEFRTRCSRLCLQYKRLQPAAPWKRRRGCDSSPIRCRRHYY